MLSVRLSVRLYAHVRHEHCVENVQDTYVDDSLFKDHEGNQTFDIHQMLFSCMEFTAISITNYVASARKNDSVTRFTENLNFCIFLMDLWRHVLH
jgi:hypothetical protein